MPDIFETDAEAFFCKGILPYFKNDIQDDKFKRGAILQFRHVVIITVGLKLGTRSIHCPDSADLLRLFHHLKDSIRSKEIPKDSDLYKLIRLDSLCTQDAVFVVTGSLDEDSQKVVNKIASIRYNQ